MIKYEFMRAHGKGSEGSEKRGGGAKKGGGTQLRHPPVYATAIARTYIIFHGPKYTQFKSGTAAIALKRKLAAFSIHFAHFKLR